MAEENSGTDDTAGDETGGEVSNSGSGSWMDGIDQSMRSDPALKNFNNVNDLAREHISAQTLIGRKGVILPQEGDSESVRTTYRESMGVPADGSGYDLEGYSAPDGVVLDDLFFDRMRSVASDQDIPNGTFTKLLQGYADMHKELMDQQISATSAESQKLDEALRADWGTAYDAKTDIAGTALHQLANGDSAKIAEIELRDGSLLGDNTEFIRVMAQAGENLQEKGLLGEKQVHIGVTPKEALAKISSLESDPEFFKALTDDQHIGHANAVEERGRLLELAYPEG